MKESTQDRILGIFQEHSRLSGEETVYLYEEKYGRNGTSDVVRTAISALTRKGLLREAGDTTSVNGPVKTWTVNDGPTPTEAIVTLRKLSKAEITTDWQKIEAKLNTLKSLLIKNVQDDGFLASYVDDVQSSINSLKGAI